MNNRPELDFISVETDPNPTHAVIWLHGLGADGHDFEGIVPQLSLPEGAKIRFVFPHAPRMPVTVNGGFEMRAWYDIISMDFKRKVDLTHIRESCDQVLSLIKAQGELGIPSENIMLAGFSQGGVIALQLGLQIPCPLAGVIALSCYLGDETPEASANGLKTPFLMAHGAHDPVVPYELGQSAYERLRQKGIDAAFFSYPMGHQVCDQEITEISDFMRRFLK